ncbi:MAG TPA: alpha/beta hydrolase [Clostridiales bacterium]|nr:alpha/beta hydrolase [Clostridiales bacterium]
MNFGKFAFRIIDYIYYPFQNYKKFKDVEVEKNIVYQDAHKRCKYDIYYKKTDEAMPVLVNFHGGGWLAGDKKYRKSLAEYYASKGWFVVNAGYRLGPECPFPAQIEDSINCLNHLPTLKERFNLDFSKVVITGDSAGAHISACTIAAITDENYRKALEVPVPAVVPTALVGFCGPYDIKEMTNFKLLPPAVRSLMKGFTGHKYKKDYSDYEEFKFHKELSPINFVNEKWPKSLIVHAEKDIFCAGHGQALIKALEENGVEAKEFSTKKLTENHCFHLIFYKKVSKRAFEEVFKFLDEIKNDAQ